MKVPQLLGKSSLLALAFGATAAAAASSDPQDPPAQAAGAGNGNDPKDDPVDPADDPVDPPANPQAAAPPIDPAAAEASDTVLASVALQGMAEARMLGHGEGFAAANERMKLVFDSAEAKANPAMATFLLLNSDAKAGDVIAKLKEAPGAAAPARGAVQPRIELNKGGNGAAAAAGEGEHDTGKDADFDPWSKVAALNQPNAFAQPGLTIGGTTYVLTPQPAQ